MFISFYPHIIYSENKSQICKYIHRDQFEHLQQSVVQLHHRSLLLHVLMRELTFCAPTPLWEVTGFGFLLPLHDSWLALPVVPSSLCTRD